MPGEGGRWSADAALRALRAVLVVPPLLALTFEVIGNGQMALFAVFGSFAALIFSSFGGTRRDKAIAHLGLAVAGSIALTIGTAVSGVTALAVLVTFPVAFAIFVGGLAGPNSASGVTGALLAYVLPVASVGGVGTIGSRLAGWWLAQAVSTAAVLLLARPSAGDKLRMAAAASAAALAGQLAAASRGQATAAHRDAALAARRRLMSLFLATPFRPTGLAIVDQALANLIHVLEWCTSLTCDAACTDLGAAGPADARLLATAGRVLGQAAALMNGEEGPEPDIAGLLKDKAASIAAQERTSGDGASAAVAATQAAHAQSVAVAVQAAAADTMIATRRADPQAVAAKRSSWYGTGGAAGAIKPARLHASVRSVWFQSALRGSLALAVAVAAADLTGVQHGFWVVLGTLSVLRTNAASTGATALRALSGTAAGFAIGAGLMLAIGTSHAALWAVLPVAVVIAAYSPGILPFEVGQAGFTVTVIVLFNLLVPTGWTVGLLRVEDVALGCVVSLVVGILFWPHGASTVVGDDLADAFRYGADYLTQSVDWALGLRARPPDGGVATISAAIMLDDALRGYLSEQGAKRLTKDELWRLVMASTRLRLTAYSMAGLPGPARLDGGRALSTCAADLAGFYRQVADQVGRSSGPLVRVMLPPPGEPCSPDSANPHVVWVSDHLQHLSDHAAAVTGPALRLAQQRRAPWWR